MNKYRIVPVALLAGVAASATSGFAWSQTTGLLEEIVVTAQKRDQSAQDIGIAIAAMDGDSMRELGVNTVESMLDYVPGTGFYDVSGGGVPVVVVRGVGLQSFRVNDTPTTAVYVDDVYQTSVALAATTLFDIERMEVLKGPQGGLYGRNAVGGAVQVITQRPSFDEVNGYLSGGFGQYQRVVAEGAVGGPLTDSLAGRLSATYSSSDDTYFESSQGFEHGEEDVWAVRGQIAYQFSDSNEWLLKIGSGEDQSETPLLRAVGLWEPLGLGIVPQSNLADGAILNAGGAGPGLYAVCSDLLQGKRNPGRCESIDGNTPQELGIKGVHDSASGAKPQLDNAWVTSVLRGDIDFGNYSFTSISAYTDFDHGRTVDLDAVPSVQQHIDYKSTIEMLSQEFRLAYDGGEDVQWILGVNYAEDELEENTLLLGATGLLPLALGGATSVDQPYTQNTDSLAIYGHFDWQFADNLNLILEGRYTREEKALKGGTLIGGTDIYIVFADDDETYDAPSGKVALEWTPSDEALFYASVSQGYKSGGFFGGFATSDSQLDPFDEETILAYEAGFKSDWSDAGVRLNGAVFFYDRQDIQASGFDTSGVVGVQRLTNVGDAEVYGGELEMTWLPTDRLTFNASMAYIESEITSSDKNKADIFLSTTTAPFEGAQLPNQPQWSGSFIGRYDHPVTANLTGSLQLEYLYTGDQELQQAVIPQERFLVEEESYALVNVRMILASMDAGWSATAFVTNATDEEYRAVLARDDLGGVYEIYGEPRIWGVRVEYAF